MNYRQISYSQPYWTNLRIAFVIILAAISLLLFANSSVHAEGEIESKLRDALEQRISDEGASFEGHKLSELESYTIVTGLSDDEFQQLIEPLGDVEWHKIELTFGREDSQTALVIHAYRVIHLEFPH